MLDRDAPVSERGGVPRTAGNRAAGGESRSPLRVMLTIAAVVFFWEIVLMLLFLNAEMTSRYLPLLDAGVLVLLMTPTLYWLVYRPLATDVVLLRKSEEALKESQRRLEEIAVSDELTGLHNRRGFFELANRQLQVADRSGSELFLLFADIDGLKAINDQLGHAAGDQAIAETAAVLRRTFRQADVIARIGGDEFAVLLTDRPGVTDEESALERLRKNLADENAKPGRRYPLSVSVGIARWDRESGATIEELIGRADELMYRAKRKNDAAREH